jgi:hypothetical protein
VDVGVTSAGAEGAFIGADELGFVEAPEGGEPSTARLKKEGGRCRVVEAAKPFAHCRDTREARRADSPNDAPLRF